MSELSTYAFRADKAKTSFPNPTDVEMLKKYMILPTYQLFDVDVPANGMNRVSIYNSNTTYPVPDLQIRSIRNSNNNIVFGGVTICLFESRILDSGGEPGAREVEIYAMNTNNFPVKVYCIANWITRPFGEPYPIGNEWPYVIG